jgi:hypothetical protein
MFAAMNARLVLPVLLSVLLPPLALAQDPEKGFGIDTPGDYQWRLVSAGQGAASRVE